MDQETFIHWVELPEAQSFRFKDLPGLIACALHENELAQAAAEINLLPELQALVDSGELVVRDPLTLGQHPFPHGAALRRAVLLPDRDIRPLLASRGIGLRLIPFGSGPDHWTIENAADAIAMHYGWHQGARDTLRKQMAQAAATGDLTVRDPHTDLPYRPGCVRADHDLMTPADVDEWLAKQGVAYRFPTTTAAKTPVPPSRARFVIEARPFEVPAELLALPDDEVVAFEHWEMQTKGPNFRTKCSAYLAGQLKADIRERIDRQRDGWFTISEAAHVIAKVRPNSDETYIEGSILEAITKKELYAYQAESRFKLNSDSTGRVDKVRSALDLFKVPELDAWLRESTGYVFPIANAAPVFATPAAAIETPKQRRARFLQMHDDEVSAGREFGALMRITEIEKRTRPTADRSNIGKDIRKARIERDEERRGGALTRLLG